jgi:hypothetical protein
MQYPRKIYFVDTGFLKYLSLNPDKSRSLENLAAIELVRRGYDLYYWRNDKGEEVDFVVLENQKVSRLIQVSYDMSMENTREREVRALKKGMMHFGLKKGIILTANREESIKDRDSEIDVIPFPKWLLSDSSF